MSLFENDVDWSGAGTRMDYFLKITGALFTLKVWRISPHIVHVFSIVL
jgi:hypothetical protein